MEKDYYKILGVEETASQAEIKKVFRKAAKKFHPDHNPNNKRAEEKFKALSEAYDTLSDEKKRQEYDMMRKYGAFGGHPGGPTGHPGGPNPFGGFDLNDLMRGAGGSVRFSNGGGGAGGFEDIFGSMFGEAQGHRPRSPRRTRTRRPVPDGWDTAATVTITFREAIDGTTKILSMADGGKKIRVKIAAGVEDGSQIRLSGQGQPSPYGGRNGDLIITVRVMADKDYKRVGNDIHSSIEISFVEAIKGCKQKVKTLTRTVALTIPPGTQPGTKMRLKGMGLAVDNQTGDQYVEIKVTIPTTLTDDQKRLLDEWEG